VIGSIERGWVGPQFCNLSRIVSLGDSETRSTTAFPPSLACPWRTVEGLLGISTICDVSGTVEALHAESVGSTLLLLEFFNSMALIGVYLAR
jgi:hypothetical protein